MKTPANRNLMVAVLNGATFVVSSYIDETYGTWTESYSPASNANGYIKSVTGASNWTYCPVCGNAQGQVSCGCDHKDENQYEFFSNSDLVAHLRKLRNKGYAIIIK